MKRGLSQEGLKLIACVSMFLDHIGAMVFPDQIWLRIIGRLAFPIYCFLLVEGIHRTKDMKQYQSRLILAAVLAELPFDLAISGRIDLKSSSVMVTLLLGFWAVQAIQSRDSLWKRALILPLYLAAEFLRADYAGTGILLILLFEVTRTGSKWMQVLGMVLLNWMGSPAYGLPMQLYAVLALVPICLYNGRKLTHSKWVQWGFYLFYPVHLMLLYFVKSMV